MRTCRFVLAAAALAASATLASGCGGTSGAANGAAGIVPASAAAYIAIDTDPGSSQWKTINDLAGHFPDKQKGVDSIKRSMRKDGIDYDHDLKPALGPEIDVVLLDFAHNGEDVVGLMQPKDESALKRVIAKGNAKDPSSKLLYEKLGDWEVFSEKQAVIDRFRRESQASGPRLEDDAAFKRGMGAVPDDSLVKAYVSGQKVMDAIGDYGGPGVSKFITKVGTLDWMVAALHASSDGIRYDTIVRGTPGDLFHGVHASPGFHPSLPSRIPSDALFYFTFHGTKGMFDGLRNIPELQTRSARPAVDLVRDLGTLLQGENALYVRRPPSGQVPEVTLVTEPKAGTNGARKLDTIFDNYALNFGTVPTHVSVAGIRARRLDFGPFKLYYGNVGGELVITDLRAGITGLTTGLSRLDQSDTFKDALDKSGMPSKTQGFLYVDVRGGLGLVQKLSSAPIPGEVERNLKPLRSAVEYAASRPSEVQVTLFLRIK